MRQTHDAHKKPLLQSKAHEQEDRVCQECRQLAPCDRRHLEARQPQPLAPARTCQRQDDQEWRQEQDQLM